VLPDLRSVRSSREKSREKSCEEKPQFVGGCVRVTKKNSETLEGELKEQARSSLSGEPRGAVFLGERIG